MSNVPSEFKAAFSLTAQLLKIQAVPLLSLWIFDSMVTTTFEAYLREATHSTDSQRLLFQAGLGFWGIGETVLIFLILSWGLPKTPAYHSFQLLNSPFNKPYINSFFAEYLRMLARVLIGSLLLIIPGLYRYCRLIFVPYIALFAKAYDDGSADALDLSYALSKRPFIKILLVFIITSALMLLFEFLAHLHPTLHILPIRVFGFAMSLLISIWTYSFIFILFKKTLEEHQWN